MPDIINKKKKNEQTLVDDSYTNVAQTPAQTPIKGQTHEDLTQQDIALAAAKEMALKNSQGNTAQSQVTDAYTGKQTTTAAKGGTVAGTTDYAKIIADLQAKNDELNTKVTDTESKYTELYNKLNSSPTSTGSNYAEYAQSIIDSLLNTPSFTYDVNSDPLYQQYKQSYEQGAKLASENALAQGAMLTGGYSNSAAQIAAQQAGQQYMSQLNDVIPDLYSIAYDRYNNELTDKYNKIDLLNTLDQQEYNREAAAAELELENKKAEYDYTIDYIKAMADAQNGNTFNPSTSELAEIRAKLKEYQDAGDTDGIELVLLALKNEGLNDDIYANLVSTYLEDKIDTSSKTIKTNGTNGYGYSR